MQGCFSDFAPAYLWALHIAFLSTIGMLMACPAFFANLSAILIASLRNLLWQLPVHFKVILHLLQMLACLRWSDLQHEPLALWWSLDMLWLVPVEQMRMFHVGCLV